MIRTGRWWKLGHLIRTDLLRLPALAILLALAGCSADISKKQSEKRPGDLQISKISFAALPGWANDNHLAALQAFKTGCPKLMRRGARPAPAGFPGGTLNWRGICQAANKVAPATDAIARQFFEQHTTPWSVSTGSGDGLFTGYYEADLRVAKRPDARYRYPVYGRPADLIRVRLGDFGETPAAKTLIGRKRGQRLVPYPTRAEIEKGALKGKASPVVWTDNPVDLFFLHIQGSGRATLPDGTSTRLGFAATNGRKYTAIGRTLIRQGHLSRDGVSMQTIRRWLTTNRDKAQSIMNENARYVFFRKLSGPGPIGSLGVALSAGRSLAVDPARIPMGAPIWIETTDALSANQPWRRLMVAQDTGAAIKGVVRGDIFFGHGADAARRAGAMNRPGQMFVLLPRARVTP